MAMSNLKTLIGDRVLIKPKEPEKVTKFGLVIPDTAVERGQLPSEGVVVALPDPTATLGLTDPNSFLSVGDNVIFNAYNAQDVVITEDDGEKVKCKLLFIDAVYCIIYPTAHAV